MGIHHYKLEAIPVVFAKKFKDSLAEKLNDDWAWIGSSPSNEFLNALRVLLPLDKSWGSTEEYINHSEWSSDLRIWKNDDNEEIIEGIKFRFSPVVDDISVLGDFLSLCKKEGCVLFANESKLVLEPTLDEVLIDFKRSRAFKFMLANERRSGND